ncbi:Hypothetical Protein FCC1311_024662 [Hondaea fermentalgiana]|uniref:Uncharacterized protein n=1 Tax=Hondaea fermentalgiana TaxID=2315210 RepID=A0A2R5G6U3_9STRA|nr:Hypothetical Protein FCC1311_024662 [Hondaea fermentalgiana]|eukprot:GBG26245.1 Hypothetical Protein FCC1311_024662 [Hondaea fermentalgiana]
MAIAMSQEETSRTESRYEPTKVQRPQNGHKIPSGSSKPSDEVKGTGEIRLRSLEVVHRMHDDEREKRELAHKQALQYAQERHAKVEHAFQRAQKLKSKLREAIKSIDESDQGSITANGDAKCTSNNESARSRVLQIDRGLPDAAAIGSSTMVSPMLAKTLRHIEDTLWTPLF